MNRRTENGNAVDYHIGIDWLSFTKEVKPDLDQSDYEFRQTIIPLFFPDSDQVEKNHTELFTVIDVQSGRAPYKQSIVFDWGARLYYNQNLPHALLEISGIGCKALRSFSLMEAFLSFALDRITRVDLAVDVDCDTQPIEIITAGISGRFKSLSQITSDTGDTVYIGSRKSDKFLRVYRYAEPHPRHKLLRYEFVFKKKIAQPLMGAFISSGYDYVGLAQQCKEQYMLETTNWPVEGDMIDFKMDYDQRTAGGTLRWLITSVAPAFRSLVDNGLIDDPEKFLSDYFLKGVQTS